MPQPKAQPTDRDDDELALEGEVLSGEVIEGDVVDAELPESEVQAARRAPGARTRVVLNDPETNEDADEDADEGDTSEASSDDEDAFEPDAVIDASVEEPEIDISVLPTPAKKKAADNSKEGALSLRDPLAAYMRDVQRYPLLKLEETQALAETYVTTGDLDAARKLVTANLRLVVKIAYDYRQAHKNLLDLIQEGNIGLMQAVKKYDPYRGVKLSSYAAWWIRAYMLRFILNNSRLVKLGTTQAQRKLFFNLKKEKARLSAMGIEATAEVIANRLQVTTEEVNQMDARLSSGDASLDAPFGNAEGKSSSRIEQLADTESSRADDRLANTELHDLLTSKIREYGKTLVGKEAVIFEERLLADEPKTLQQLGDRFGVTRERVRQLEKRLQGRIKAYLESQIESSALP